jgi:hypothetical protein
MQKTLFAALVALVAACGTAREPFKEAQSGDGTDPGLGGPATEPKCQGLRCQQADCGGGDTTVTGTFFAPNGTLPLYNGIVYVPNTDPDALPKGTTCDTCGVVTGDPVVTALSEADGTFTLKNVPAGKDIPLVLQIGKWRRQVTIPEVRACEETKLTNPEMTRLPKSQAEGNLPHIALTTGGCDRLGCVLPKIGIDPSEFGIASDGPAKAVHTFIGGGFQDGDRARGPSGAPKAETLWNDLAALKRYDLVVLSCECSERKGAPGFNGGTKDTPSFDAMTSYLQAGGRIFTTDYMYTWYRDTPDADLKAATSVRGGAPLGGNPMAISTSFPKGQALASWLGTVGSGAALPADYVFSNFISVDPAKAQTWATSPSPQGPRVFTVNVPVGAPAAQQCGRGVHIDAHVNQNGTDDVNASYPSSCNSPLKPAESLLAFFFFDLASCIQDDKESPKPPAIK